MNISDNELRNIIDQVFVNYDRDGSGTLDTREIVNFFNEVFQRAGDPTRIDQY